MFRIRKIYDDITPANRTAIEQVAAIMRRQFPLITQAQVEIIPSRLHYPLKYQFRAILFVVEDAKFRVKGLALLLHFPDLNFCHLEFISAAPGRTGGGVLYERVREEAASPQVSGLFFECLPDEAALCRDTEVLKQNIARGRLHECYGARRLVLIVHRGHDIHHVRDRGYVEAPVRIPAILKEWEKIEIWHGGRNAISSNKRVWL